MSTGYRIISTLLGPKGPPRQTWTQTVKADLKDLLIKHMAQDRKLWTAVISGESDPLKEIFDYK